MTFPPGPKRFLESQTCRLLLDRVDPLRHLTLNGVRGESRTGSGAMPRLGTTAGGESGSPWWELDRFQLLDRSFQAPCFPFVDPDGNRLTSAPTWQQTSRQETYSADRVVLTGDGGTGKSVNLTWLWWQANRATTTANGRSHSAGVAFRLNLYELPEVRDSFLEEVLIPQVRKLAAEIAVQASRQQTKPGSESQRTDAQRQEHARQLAGKLRKESASDEQLVRWLESLQRRGLIELFFDGLDQVAGSGHALRILDRLLHHVDWHRCRFVLAARPHALRRHWDRLFENEKQRWSFVALDEFDESQQRLLLGNKFDKIPTEGRALLTNPRALDYILKLDDDELANLRSPADVYDRATWHMLKEGMRASERARRLGLHPGEHAPDHVQQGFLDTDAQDLEGLDQILWRDRTLQEYYTALHAVRWSTPEDAAAMNEWLYLPHRPETEKYYMVWRFATEMPPRSRAPDCWVRAMRPIYLPGDGQLDTTKRSNEMLYRSWPTMEAYAQSDQGSARAVRDAYWSEFQAILDNQQGSKRSRAAIEFQSLFREVPDGPFQMGTTDDKQGMPDEARRFWEGWLRDSRTNSDDAVEEMVTRGNYPPGKQAEKYIALARRQLLDAVTRQDITVIENWLYSRDETPAESWRNPHIKTFLLHRYPLLLGLYRLFDPGHGLRQEWFAETLERVCPTPEHPVIFVSWYDAWAFCQWAHWDDKSCRLPHENEWEKAAKAGTPWDRRRWWGISSKKNVALQTNPLKLARPRGQRSLMSRIPNVMATTRIRGTSWTCSATSGNGQPTSIAGLTRSMRSPIPPRVSVGAGRGTTLHGSSGLRSVTSSFQWTSSTS